MSYVLQNGRRCYRDDRTGRVVVDNVSQAEADKREQRSQCGSAPHTGVFRRAAILLIVLTAFAAALAYNRQHVSEAVTAIRDYMSAAAETADGGEDRGNSGDEAQERLAGLIGASAQRYLEAADIESCSGEERQMIINGIYARHGREFQSAENAGYFSSQDWYSPVPGKTDEEIIAEFNEYERANVDFLSRNR